MEDFSSLEEVKKSYKKLSLELHPDKNQHISTSKFIEVTNAYKFIMSNKAIYDNMLRQSDVRHFKERMIIVNCEEDEVEC